MSAHILARPVAKTSLITLLVAFLKARLAGTSKPETDYDVWTSGARGL